MGELHPVVQTCQNPGFAHFLSRILLWTFQKKEKKKKEKKKMLHMQLDETIVSIYKLHVVFFYKFLIIDIQVNLKIVL